jgi:hypothetical protein
MWVWRRSIRTLMRCTIVAATSVLANCALPPDGSYRFQAAIEDPPVAYRNARAGDPLRITVNLQNLSDKYIPISAPDGRPGGVYLQVTASSSTGFIGRPSVQTGLRGGRLIASGPDAGTPFLFDDHNDAVQSLASTGPILLHLNGTTIRNILSLQANEAAFVVELPIDWSRVPSGAPGTKTYSIPVFVTLNLDFAYVDYTGKQYAFTRGVRRTVQAILINDLRPGSIFRPANGPVSGVFSQR